MAPVSIAKRPVGADCNCGRRIIQIRKSAYLGSCDKKVSGTFCEELALRVLRTKGTRHLLIAHCLVALWSAVKASTGYAFPVAGTEICFTQRVADSTIALHRL